MKKLEELRRRHTGPIGCPSDTKNPDNWDWDNWDNWPEEDKEMFPIEEEMGLEEALHFNSHGKETEDPETWNDDFYDYEWLEQNGTFRETDVPELEEVATEMGYVYLYKGKYLAQADNGGVQIDHPAPEEVIQWFFDHYGKRLWESNMKNKEEKLMNENISFIDRWHDTCELIPDCDNVWFIADGRIYVGMYEPEQKIFCMADGLGLSLADVRQWRYLNSRNVVGFPQEKQIIAVEVPQLPCPIPGIFSDHCICPDSGDEFSGVLLDDVYEFLDMDVDAVLPWDKVFAWYELPDEPLVILPPTGCTEPTCPECEEIDFDIEPAEEEFPAEESGEDIGPEPLPEIGPDPEPLPEVSEEAPVEGAEAEEPAAEGGSAIAAANAETEELPGKEEEEKLVHESMEFNDFPYAEGDDGDDPLSLKVAEWYKEEYPTDSMGDEIDDYITFNHIFQCLDAYDDIYQYLPGDSVIRERVFDKLADLMGVDYDYVYDQYLKCADHKADWSKVSPSYIEDLYKQGQITSSERDEMLGNIERAPKRENRVFKTPNTKLNEARVYYDFPGDYRPWSGAVDTWNTIEENDAIDGLEQFLDECYPDGIGETELNDLLWFEPETVFEYLGIRNPYDEDEDEEEEEEDEEQEPSATEEYKGYEIYTWEYPGDVSYVTICKNDRYVDDAKDVEDAKKKIDDGELKESKIRERIHRIEHKGNVIGYAEPGEDEYLFYSNGKSATRPIGFISADDGKVYLTGHLAKEVYEAFPYYIELKKHESIKEKKASKIKSFKESIRGNTKEFIKNVEEYINGWGEEKWESIRVNVQGLQEYTRYGTLNEAIRQYVEGGDLDCYYYQVQNTLNELYENTPEEAAKWENYPFDKLWERYINIMCLYLPKAYKLHTGKELDMRKDPESEYSQKVRANYGENKLSVCEFLRERGLTKAERHNRAMDKIFNNHRAIIDSQKDFLRGKGVSDEELEELDHGTGLSHDAIGGKIRDMGCWDEYWNTGKKVCEHLEHISDESYGKWVKLKRKLDHEYLADYCIESLPPYEAELVINYLADMNGIENGDLNDY